MQPDILWPRIDAILANVTTGRLDIAARFKAKAGKHVRCEDDTTRSAQPGWIEMEDLNGDGTAEAWVEESNLFCFGNTAEAFVLLTRDAKGTWITLLDEVGVPRAPSLESALIAAYLGFIRVR